MLLPGNQTISRTICWNSIIVYLIIFLNNNKKEHLGITDCSIRVYMYSNLLLCASIALLPNHITSCIICIRINKQWPFICIIAASVVR